MDNSDWDDFYDDDDDSDPECGHCNCWWDGKSCCYCDGMDCDDE